MPPKNTNRLSGPGKIFHGISLLRSTPCHILAVLVMVFWSLFCCVTPPWDHRSSFSHTSSPINLIFSWATSVPSSSSLVKSMQVALPWGVRREKHQGKPVASSCRPSRFSICLTAIVARPFLLHLPFVWFLFFLFLLRHFCYEIFQQCRKVHRVIQSQHTHVRNPDFANFIPMSCSIQMCFLLLGLFTDERGSTSTKPSDLFLFLFFFGSFSPPSWLLKSWSSYFIPLFLLLVICIHIHKYTHT